MRVFLLEDDDLRIAAFNEILSNVELVVAKDIVAAGPAFQGAFDYVFLDHDLGDRAFVGVDDENTGSEFVRRHGDKLVGTLVIVHSWNPEGAKNMVHRLLDAGCSADDVRTVPFGKELHRLLRLIHAQAAIAAKEEQSA